MEVDFDKWNERKKKVAGFSRVYFNKGEIWFASIGKNIGDEEDGKNEYFERPLLVVRKFNNHLFLGVPLTSQKKKGAYYHQLSSFPNSTVILSQVRPFDSKRLLRKMHRITAEELKEIKIKVSNLI